MSISTKMDKKLMKIYPNFEELTDKEKSVARRALYKLYGIKNSPNRSNKCRGFINEAIRIYHLRLKIEELTADLESTKELLKSYQEDYLHKCDNCKARIWNPEDYERSYL